MVELLNAFAIVEKKKKLWWLNVNLYLFFRKCLETSVSIRFDIQTLDLQCLGLTCNDENARTKAHFAQEAARVGLAVVFPDTSPRGVSIAGDSDSYDFGTGAGFYVNATTPEWSKHYK